MEEVKIHFRKNEEEDENEELEQNNKFEFEYCSVYEKEDENFKKLINNLQKPPFTRTKKDNKVIKQYLENSELKQKFVMLNSMDRELDEMMTECSKCIELEYLPEGKILFREGDLGDKFYIILKGSVNIIKKKEVECELNLLEYFDFLESLKQQGDQFLLIETIKLNKDAFHLNLDNINFEENEIFKLIQQKKIVESCEDKNELVKIIDNYNPNLLKGESQKLKKIDIKLLKSVAFQEVASALESRKFSLLDFEKKRKTKKFEHYIFSNYEQGNFFGDYALEMHIPLRSASVVASSPSFLGVIYAKDYINYIMKTKNFMEFKESEFLANSYFKGKIEKNEFMVNHFRFFVYKEKLKGEIIFSELNNSKKIYFIKEGEIEITYDGSVQQIIQGLNEVSKKNHIPYNLHPFEEKYMSQFSRNKEPLFINSKHYKVISIKSNYILGDLMIFSRNPFVFEVTAKSNKVKYYELNYDPNSLMFKNDKILKIFETNARNKLQILFDRLFQFKQYFFDTKLSQLENETGDKPNTEILQFKFAIKRRSRSNIQLPLITTENTQENKTSRNYNLTSSKTLGILKLSSSQNFAQTNSSSNTSRLHVSDKSKNKLLVESPRSPVQGNNLKPHKSIFQTEHTKNKNSVKFNLKISEEAKRFDPELIREFNLTKSKSITKNRIEITSIDKEDDENPTTPFQRKTKRSKTEYSKSGNIDFNSIISNMPSAGIPQKFKIHENSNLHQVVSNFNHLKPTNNLLNY